MFPNKNERSRLLVLFANNDINKLVCVWGVCTKLCEIGRVKCYQQGSFVLSDCPRITATVSMAAKQSGTTRGGGAAPPCSPLFYWIHKCHSYYGMN